MQDLPPDSFPPVIQANPTPPLSIQQFLTITGSILGSITVIVAFVVYAYKLGSLHQRVTNSESIVVNAWNEVKKDIADMKLELGGWNSWRTDMTGWRAETSQRLDTQEREVTGLRDWRHEVENEELGRRLTSARKRT